MIDFDTLEGDYAEAYQKMNYLWNQVPIDVKFSQEYLDSNHHKEKWEEFKKELLEDIEFDEWLEKQK